jgi:hypothetical protein
LSIFASAISNDDAIIVVDQSRRQGQETGHQVQDGCSVSTRRYCWGQHSVY